jgi:hypothetical protein
MDVDELLLRAWTAVEKANIPEKLQETAFKEAVAFLRGSADPASELPNKSRVAHATQRAPQADTGGERTLEDDFFTQLAYESGADEDDLRDILTLAQDGKVLVTPPTRNLGTSKAQQARTVVALVGGARSKGLGEKPINAEAVREELRRKGCYDRANHSSHVGKMKGFNRGANSDELLPTSKWHEDFAVAIATALGRKSDDK